MIHIGVSPAGVEWNYWPRSGATPEEITKGVATQTTRLAHFWDLHNSKQAVPAVEPAPVAVEPAPEPKTLAELQAAYKEARSQMYKRAAAVRKAREAAILKASRNNTWSTVTLPEVHTDARYEVLRSRVAKLNKAIKNAK